MSRMSTKLATSHPAAATAAAAASTGCCSPTTLMVNRTLNGSPSFHRIISMNLPHRRGLMTLLPTARLAHVSRLVSMRAPRHASLVTECDATDEGQQQPTQQRQQQLKVHGPDDDTHTQKEGDGPNPTCQDMDRKSLSPFDLLKEKNINEAILALGKADKWKEILCLYHENEEDFTALNYETVMSQLGRIRSVHHQRDDPRVQEFSKPSSSTRTMASRRTLPGAAFVNERDAEAFMSQVTFTQISDEEREFDEDLMNGPLFEVFYADLSSKLVLHRTPWMGARAVASILHDIAKLDLVDNQSTETIFSLFEDDKTAALLFDNDDPQDIVNCAWACASLEIESPNLFRLLDQNAEWLLENGNQQQLSNCAWACGVLGVQAPNLSRLLLLNQGYVSR